MRRRGYSSHVIVPPFGGQVVFHRPDQVDPLRPAIVYAHGAAGDHTQTLDLVQYGIAKHVAAWARAGFVVLSADWGGPYTFGNDTELAAMRAGVDWLWSMPWFCRPGRVTITGASMGMLSCARFLRDYPNDVQAMLCWQPAVDIEGLRERDSFGLRDTINAAWGLPAGSLESTGTPIPTRGRPADPANLAIRPELPTQLHYSLGDTITPPGPVLGYENARPGTTAVKDSDTEDHDAAQIAASSTQVTTGFLFQHAMREG